MTVEPGEIKPAGIEFTLFLVFDTGFQTELPVTGWDPKFDHTGKIATATIEQRTLQLGDTQVVTVDWSRVIYSAVYSNNQAFSR